MRKIRQLQNSRESHSFLARLWRNTRKTCATYETFLVTLLSWIIPSLFIMQLASVYNFLVNDPTLRGGNLYTHTSFLFPLVILFWLFYDSQLPMLLDQYFQRITALWFCAALIPLSALIFEPIYLFPRICIYFVLWWAVYVVLVGYLQKLMSRSPLRTFVSDYQKQEIIQFICWRLGAFMLLIFYISPWSTELLATLFFPPNSSQFALSGQCWSYYFLASLLWIANRAIAHNLFHYPVLLSEEVTEPLSTSHHEGIKTTIVQIITTILAIFYAITFLALSYATLVLFAYRIGIAT